MELFMQIDIVMDESTTRTWLQQTHMHMHAHTHRKTTLTWQHDINLLPHREQIDGSKVFKYTK